MVLAIVAAIILAVTFVRELVLVGLLGARPAADRSTTSASCAAGRAEDQPAADFGGSMNHSRNSVQRPSPSNRQTKMFEYFLPFA